MDTVTIEITVWDQYQIGALLDKIEKDSRVVSLTRLDQ